MKFLWSLGPDLRLDIDSDDDDDDDAPNVVPWDSGAQTEEQSTDSPELKEDSPLHGDQPAQSSSNLLVGLVEGEPSIDEIKSGVNSKIHWPSPNPDTSSTSFEISQIAFATRRMGDQKGEGTNISEKPRVPEKSEHRFYKQPPKDARRYSGKDPCKYASKGSCKVCSDNFSKNSPKDSRTSQRHYDNSSPKQNGTAPINVTPPLNLYPEEDNTSSVKDDQIGRDISQAQGSSEVENLPATKFTSKAGDVSETEDSPEGEDPDKAQTENGAIARDALQNSNPSTTGDESKTENSAEAADKSAPKDSADPQDTLHSITFLTTGDMPNSKEEEEKIWAHKGDSTSGAGVAEAEDRAKSPNAHQTAFHRLMKM